MYRRNYRFCYRVLSTPSGSQHRHFHGLGGRKRTLIHSNHVTRHVLQHQQQRGVALVARLIRGVLKIRYILLGSAVGGGVQLTRKFDEWKENLPDFKWMNDILPDDLKINRLGRSLSNLRDKISSDNQFFSNVANSVTASVDVFSQWLEEARAARQKDLEEQSMAAVMEPAGKIVEFPDKMKNDNHSSSHIKSFLGTSSEEEKAPMTERKRLQELQQDMMRTQRRYQKELEQLEKDNKVLRQQLLLMKEDKPKKKVKKSLIDLYSEVLDELSGYDSTYAAQDHLPRVIVVGDQSAGKTSALEMIAQARIFPRGAGEMMTRAPVKVTLSEGPNHIAFFKGSTRVYDLTKEADLSDLRDDIERRMAASVRGGKSISSDVITLTVQGPGVKRMVLVDLPGVISTVTTEMSKDTREAIKGLTKTYMSNPNAIILCIQDGSVDAERSIITDLVSEMDPDGKRTIFVLTKVDIAEKNMANPGRIKKILDGKLFPMKALGYFACVTGMGSRNETIESIQNYEEEFFRKSRLCQDGILTASQCTTQNLSLAVSECFWKMVKASVEEQAKMFKTTLFDLETEWKNLFPQQRQLSRDELFEKARGEILDDLLKMTSYSPNHWESLILDKFWNRIASYFFDRVYIPAAQTSTSGTFNTQTDINLKHWAEGSLSKKAVEVGWEALKEQFKELIRQSSRVKGHDTIFDHLKEAVADEALKRHEWDPQSAEILKIIQMNSLEDRSVPDQIAWYAAVSFLERSLSEKLVETESELYNEVGPGLLERWTYWKWKTPEQIKKSWIKSELEKLLLNSHQCHEGHLPSLSIEEITTIRKNLQAQDVEVDSEAIKQVWFLLFRQQFLHSALERAGNCRGFFQTYQRVSVSHTQEVISQCNDVILFWRLHQMMKTTSNTLRQYIMNVESRRLEMEIKDTLDDFSVDEDKKETLLTGRRVTLAEEIKKVRQIQDKLRLFIEALNQEKS